MTLDIDFKEVQAVVGAIREIGLLTENRVVDWERFQEKRNDPTNADRQDRHRKKSNVTARYVTPQDRTEQYRTYNTEHTTQDRRVQTLEDTTGQKDSSVLENAEDDVLADDAPTWFEDSTHREDNQEGLARKEGLTIAELDLGDEAIRICQDARPGADPLVVCEKFREWGHDKPATGWQRSLKTFAIKERLSDDEQRAAERGKYNGSGPRLPGETAAEYCSRTQDPSISQMTSQELSEMVRKIQR